MPSRESLSFDASWEVVDREVRRRARNYRNSLLRTWEKNEFREIISDVRNLYLALDLRPSTSPQANSMSRGSYDSIIEYFQKAYDTNRCEPIIEAYTSATGFHRRINEDLANLVSTNNLRDIGISPNAPTRHYWQGPLDIACIFVNHPHLRRYEIKEETKAYRGMTVPRRVLENYRGGTRWMNKTFLSTSRLETTASKFQGQSGLEVGCVCHFTLVPSNRRTAIDIAAMSVFDEQEILILPYTTFEVLKGVERDYRDEEGQDPHIIELRECHELEDEN